MNLDPKSKSVTSFFMLAAIIVMALLAWSVSRDKNEAAKQVVGAAEITVPDEPTTR